jgi:hypothetical protein
MLLTQTTNQAPQPGYFETHRNLIVGTFFCSGQMSLELAHFLHAPIEQVHADQYQETNSMLFVPWQGEEYL